MENPCNIPKNQEISQDAFPGMVSNPNCTNVAVQQAANNTDQVTIDNEMQSYINEKGVPVLYYPYLYDIDKSEKIYGEHRAAKYAHPFDILAYLEIKDTPSWVSQMTGYENSDTVTAWIHIRTFYNTVDGILKNSQDKRSEEYTQIYNSNAIADRDILHHIEPKVKDLIQLKTYGCDREWNRGNNIYEITNKEDQIFSENFNLSMGHYIWKITCKRYRYSYEDGMSSLDLPDPDNWYIGEQGEKGNSQVYDSQDCVKMFLANTDVITEDGGEIAVETDEEQTIADEKGIETKKITYAKEYHQDDIEDSKREFDLSENEPGVYTNDFNSTNVITNGYL